MRPDMMVQPSEEVILGSSSACLSLTGHEFQEDKTFKACARFTLNSEAQQLTEVSTNKCVRWSESQGFWDMGDCKVVLSLFRTKDYAASLQFSGLSTHRVCNLKSPEQCLAVSQPSDLTRLQVHAELDGLVGLDAVKRQAKQMMARLRFDGQRAKHRLGSLAAGTMHMQFRGNPGTGKTVVARIMAKFLLSLGYLKGSEGGQLFTEVSRKDLVAEYVGQTAPLVEKAVKSAMGGILFIDEAYSLVRDDRDTFGVEAVDTLIKLMDDHRDKVVVILAGYNDEMEKFVAANPGFKSRIPFTFDFDDFTCDELVTVGELHLLPRRLFLTEEGKDSSCTLEPSAPSCMELKRTASLATGCCESFDNCPHLNMNRDNGNGRSVRNFLESAMRRMAHKTVKDHAKGRWLHGAKPFEFMAPEHLQQVRITMLRDKLQHSFDAQFLGDLDLEPALSLPMPEWQALVTAIQEGDATRAKSFFPKSSSSRGPLAELDQGGDPCGDLGEMIQHQESGIVELCGLVGLESVKAGVLDIYQLIKFDKLRQKQFKQTDEEYVPLGSQSYHMQFLGNPGTGKTVVGRLVGKILTSLGIVAIEGEIAAFKEVSRSDLVGGYVGETAKKVGALLDSVKGGVLFIDEAYSIVQGERDEFGREAVDTLIKLMEDRRKELVVILGGYKDEMETFFLSNPGFKSRVPFTFNFEDFTCPQLTQIANTNLAKAHVTMAGGAPEMLSRAIKFGTGCCTTRDQCEIARDNGNGRTVRNILELAFQGMASRVVRGNVVHSQIPHRELLTTVQVQDFTQVVAQKVETWLHQTCEGSIAGRELKALAHGLAQAAPDVWEAASLGQRPQKQGACPQRFLDMVAEKRFVVDPVDENANSDAILQGASPEVRKQFQDLNAMVGLASVKSRLMDFYALATFDEWRQKTDSEFESFLDSAFHMSFVGNPGTGKTVAARIVGRLLGQMGLITGSAKSQSKAKFVCKVGDEVIATYPKDGKSYKAYIRKIRESMGRVSISWTERKFSDVQMSSVKTLMKKPCLQASSATESPFVEVARQDLVAGHTGQTAIKVQEVVKSALGGILFIDEAYSLVKSSHDSFGKEAVDTLIKLMEDHRDEVVVILAGYELEMGQFLDSNPGFKSRVPFTFQFEDYACPELFSIGMPMFKKSELSLSSEAEEVFSAAIRFSTGCCEKPGVCGSLRDNGNGRAVRNFMESVVLNMGDRLSQQDEPTREELSEVFGSDVEQAALAAADKQLARVCRPQGDLHSLSRKLKKVATRVGQNKAGLRYLLEDQGQQVVLHDKLTARLKEIERLSSLKTAIPALKQLHGTCKAELEKVREGALAVLHAACTDDRIPLAAASKEVAKKELRLRADLVVDTVFFASALSPVVPKEEVLNCNTFARKAFDQTVKLPQMTLLDFYLDDGGQT